MGARARAVVPARPERVVAHLPLHAARHDTASAGADPLVAELVEDSVAGACLVLRGEGPRREGACGG